MASHLSSASFLLLATSVASTMVAGCGAVAEDAPLGAEGSVTVVWSAVGAGSSASAHFRADGDAEEQCTKETIGACTRTSCRRTATPSRSAGVVRIRGTAPLFSLDLEPSRYLAFDQADVRGSAPRPSTSAGSRLVISSDGSPTVPAFQSEVAYPEPLVLTSPAAHVLTPAIPTRFVPLSRSTSTVLRWKGGSPGARVHLYRPTVGTESAWQGVRCEASADAGALEIPAGFFATDEVSSLHTRALMVVERQITTRGWPITISLATEIVVADESGAYYAVELL